MVKVLGDIAPGPCPALTEQDGGYKCGLVLYPKKWIKSVHNSEALRKALLINISSGNGCDSAGENPTPDRLAALEAYAEQQKYEMYNNPERFEQTNWALKILFNISL